jgi:hypothetical protein
MNVCTAARLAVIVIASQAILGCGTLNPSPSSSAASLNGNWDLTGSQTLYQYPYISVALAVEGNEISAQGDMMVSCTNSWGIATGGGFDLSGHIAADGTFTLNESSGNQNSIQLVIAGAVPPNGADAWTGSYSFSDLAGYSGCIVNQTGSFTATELAPINGTYAGALTGSGNVVVSTTLTQGAVTSSPGPTGSPVYYLPISGTITISGSSCFTHGTSSVSTFNRIGGDIFELNFTMDDGSQILLGGQFTSSDESAFIPGSFVVNGGQCNDDHYNGTLTRQ